MTSTQHIYLSGWGAYHPEGRLTNDDLVEQLDTSHEWLDTHIGISERRKARPDEAVAEMSANASRMALERAGIGPDDLDLIVGVTSYDDYVAPASGARVGNLIGSQAHAFDVKAACSGWMVGLDVADSFLRTDKATRALVCSAEKSGIGVNPQDRTTWPFFGDAAGAAIVQTERPDRGLEVLTIKRGSDNSLHDAVEFPYGGWFRMDAPRTRVWVEAAMASMAGDLLEEIGAEIGDLRAFVAHQANLRLIERIAKDLGVDPEKHWHNVSWAGNTASAGAPTALFGGLEKHEQDLKDGDLILVVTVGSGLNVLGLALRWVSN